MFCSDCQPAPVATGRSDHAGRHRGRTSLPLVLIATSVSNRPEESFATILNTDSKKQGGYFEGDVIPDAGPVKEIHYKFVDFENTQSHRVERIALLGENHTPTTPPRAPIPTRRFGTTACPRPSPTGSRRSTTTTTRSRAAWSTRSWPTRWRSRAAPGSCPRSRNGKANGFKLYAIRPGSVYSQIGLANGDTIHAINGFDLSSPDKALEVYTKVKEATSLQVSVTRRGKEMTLNYTIK